MIKSCGNTKYENELKDKINEKLKDYKNKEYEEIYNIINNDFEKELDNKKKFIMI